MKKLFIILFFLFTTSVASVDAAPPARQNTYVSGTTIESAKVSANEDAIFNYLQAGVDTYADGTIVNADINSSANIQSDKLNLTAIAQSVANSGSTTLTGTFAANGTTNSIGNGGSDVLTLNVPGGMTLSAATTWTLTGALTFSGTIADLGTVTTANIDGGTLDGVQIGGTTATGELIVNDASDDADGLGSQGTSGQFLQSAGTGVNPTFAYAFIPTAISVFTSSDTWTKPASVSKVYVKVWGGGGGGGGSVSSSNPGSGGGGGGYSEGYVTVTGDVTVTVGAGGAGGANAGGAGVTSSFAGSTTIQASGGGGGGVGTSGGSGGTGSNGQINISGQTGKSTTGLTSGDGGNGGDSFGGGGGSGGLTADDPGDTGMVPGGGGGGASGGSGGPGGGAGAAGLVIVYY